jgi:hypothetical protein
MQLVPITTKVVTSKAIINQSINQSINLHSGIFPNFLNLPEDTYWFIFETTSMILYLPKNQPLGFKSFSGIIAKTQIENSQQKNYNSNNLGLIFQTYNIVYVK